MNASLESLKAVKAYVSAIQELIRNEPIERAVSALGSYPLDAYPEMIPTADVSLAAVFQLINRLAAHSDANRDPVSWNAAMRIVYRRVLSELEACLDDLAKMRL